MNGALSIERPGECHPQLHGQMTALLEEVENRAGTPNTADQAEDALVEHMRQVGTAEVELRTIKSVDIIVSEPLKIAGWSRPSSSAIASVSAGLSACWQAIRKTVRSACRLTK